MKEDFEKFQAEHGKIQANQLKSYEEQSKSLKEFYEKQFQQLKTDNAKLQSENQELKKPKVVDLLCTQISSNDEIVE